MPLRDLAVELLGCRSLARGLAAPTEPGAGRYGVAAAPVQPVAPTPPMEPAPPVPPSGALADELRNPATGDVSAAPTNYRFAKKWVKQALVQEKLLDRIYKSDELDDATSRKVKEAIDQLRALSKYQAYEIRDAGTSTASVPAPAPAIPAPEMVRLPGGAFWMGSPAGGSLPTASARAAAFLMGSPAARGFLQKLTGEPPEEADRSSDERRHEVTVRPFAIGKYPLTQAEWRAVMGDNPSRFAGCGDCPVENVSWHDAQAYIDKLNALTGQRFRLPTEAEWEYACRANQCTRHAGSDDLDAVAWYNGNSGGRTHPVGQKQPNAFGLYDMSGNVWEWTASAYAADYDGSETLSTNDATARRVLRGGSWLGTPDFVRAANRNRLDPAGRSDFLGFRLAQD